MLRDRVLHVLRPLGLSRGQRPTLHPGQARAFGAAGLCEERPPRQQSRSVPPGLPKAHAGRRPRVCTSRVFSLEPRHPSPPSPPGKALRRQQHTGDPTRRKTGGLPLFHSPNKNVGRTRPTSTHTQIHPFLLPSASPENVFSARETEAVPASIFKKKKKKNQVTSPRSEGKDTQDRA